MGGPTGSPQSNEYLAEQVLTGIGRYTGERAGTYKNVVCL
jgi:hypothetical protein